MSAQAGVLLFGNDRLVSRNEIDLLGHSLDAFGPDGGSTYRQGPLAMLSRVLRVTPEDRYERLPYEGESGCVVTWDGRLDNRDDLLLQLRRRSQSDFVSDATLVSLAYQYWGTDAFARLVGDWSAAIWDPVQQAVLLASDFAGNRSLYYTVTSDRVIWASSLRALLELTGTTDVSAKFVAGYLTAAIAPGVTPYADVSCVPPAHLVTCGRDGRINVRRYRDLYVSALAYRDPADYVVHLRELLCAAVQARLRASHDVWAELSGGVDSSTVVCLADHVSRRDGNIPPPVRAISCYSSESPDERKFIEAVVQQCRIDATHFDIEDCEGAVDDAGLWVTPQHPTNATLREFDLVRAGGGRVILSGHGGDVVFGNVLDNGTDILPSVTRARWLSALSRAREWALASRKTVWDILGDALSYLHTSERLADRVMRRIGQDQGPLAARSSEELAKKRFFLTAPLAGHWQAEIRRRVSRAVSLGPPVQRRLLLTLSSLLDDRSFRTPSEYPGITLTYPFLHRPLIEFVLAVPPGVLCSPGRPRRLMKAACACVLPPAVAGRFSKGRLSDPLRRRGIRHFARRHRGRTQLLEVVRRGLVDANSLESELAAIERHGVQHLRNFPELIRLERWLAARERKRDAALSAALDQADAVHAAASAR